MASCPNCGLDWIGEKIWDHFYREFTVGGGYWCDKEGTPFGGRRMLEPNEAELIADEVASHYGATRTEGYFSKLGIMKNPAGPDTRICTGCQMEFTSIPELPSQA